MSGSQTNEVDTFGPLGCVAVRCPHPCTARRLKAAVAEKLGLKPASLPLFGLFAGPLGSPQRSLDGETAVPSDTEICFQRWNVTPDKEGKLSRHDDQAVHLLYCEAKFFVEQGKIQASPEQLLELESLSDPSFPTERQYLDLARTLPGYASYVATGVVVKGDITSNDIQIPDGTVVTCVVDTDRLVLKAGESPTHWAWQLVKRWRTPSANQLEYEVCLSQQNAPVLTWIHLQTDQAYFMRLATERVCYHLKEELTQQNKAPPPANPRMAGKPFDPLVEFLNMELFRAPSFTSIDQQ